MRIRSIMAIYDDRYRFAYVQRSGHGFGQQREVGHLGD
jgi:hypothetical protein